MGHPERAERPFGWYTNFENLLCKNKIIWKNDKIKKKTLNNCFMHPDSKRGGAWTTNQFSCLPQDNRLRQYADQLLRV